jgi:hypothetical protein
MLNLSDKELDRLSQEAAQQHEPGDIVGPRLWEKLEARLDRDLGKVNPNPARGIRRLPYYYAPALLVILGVTYYFVRPDNKSHKGMSSGSPPLTAIQPASADPLKPGNSSPNSVSDNSNSTPAAPSNTVHYPGTAGASPSIAPATAMRPDASTRPVTSPAPARSKAYTASARSNDHSSFTSTNSLVSPSRRHRHNHPTAGAAGIPGATPTSHQTSGNTGNPDVSAITGATNTQTGTSGKPASARAPRDLTFSAVRGRARIAHAGSIDDSALRAFTLSSMRQPIRKGGLHINRSLTIGIVGGPDQASVSSIAGDRAGSTLGLTVDYQFANHWYIGSGLLFTKKIFSAVPQDYHVPSDYYTNANIGMGSGINYIKGSFNMLEIPLNLRYDFSTGDNVLFFAGVGTSSYLFTTENCNYYYHLYNQPNVVSKQRTYTNQPDDLFATINLSAGMEVGVSNSLSLLLAPYAKIPTRGIGFGQVQLSSVGLNLALRFTPVLSRKR